MNYHFFIEDNIWFLRDLNRDRPKSVFEHPYLAMLKRLHEKFGMKVQLDVFIATDGFNLSEMTDEYKSEWQANSDWLCFGFHSRTENPGDPYLNASYDEVYRDCVETHREIVRFAGEECLSLHTSVHYGTISKEGMRALKDCGMKGLIDLFAFEGEENLAFGIKFDDKKQPFKYDDETGLNFYYNDMIINLYKLSEIDEFVENIPIKPLSVVMIHEQYFYDFYPAYQPDYEEKLEKVFTIFENRGYKSVFLKEIG